jgi:hypothetical protein
LLGYHKADGVLTINEEQAVIVRRIFELYNEGKFGLRRIARQLESEGLLSPFTGKMLSPETIKSVITNPKYKSFIVEYGNNDIISLNEIGISQAQVSRLEKGALNKIKRKI